MRGLILLLILIVVVCPMVIGQSKSAVELPDTEVFEFISTQSGKDYSIYVAYPSNSTDQKYPLLLCLDANAGFALITQIYRYLRFGNEVPEMVIVGIGYPDDSGGFVLANRISDMTPSSLPTQDALDTESLGAKVQSGGAAKFLSFIQLELLPYLEANYPINQERAFAGHSHGGLFATYALFHAGDTFGRYIIGSPSLWYDNQVCFDFEESYASRNSDLMASVFWSVGSEEGTPERPMVPLLLKMVERLEKRNYPNLKLNYKILAGDTHLSSLPVTYSTGLRHIFE